MKFPIAAVLILCLSLVTGDAWSSRAQAQDQGPARAAKVDPAVIQTQAKSQPAPAPKPKSGPTALPKLPPGARATVPASQAEQVINLRKSIEVDENHFNELKSEREEQEKEYKDAQAEFVRVDEALVKYKKIAGETAPTDQDALKEVQRKIGVIEKARVVAKDRFDLAIENRKNSAQQFTNLEQKLQRDKKGLDRLEGKEVPAPAPAAPPTTADGAPAPTPAPGGAAAPASTPASTPAAAPVATGTPAPAPAPAATPGVPGLPGVSLVAPVANSRQKKPDSKELIEAKEDAQTKAAASKDAEAEAESATERLLSLDNEIALEQKMLTTGRKQHANATERQTIVSDWFRRESLAGAAREKLDTILVQVNEVEARLKSANQDITDHSTRLQELQSERSELQAQQINALHKAEAARAQVMIAEKDIARLENPLAFRNIARWMIDHGVKLAAISLAMLMGLWLSKLFSGRIIWFLAHNGARGSSIEREARARTLIGVFHNAASLAIVVGGGLMLLQEVGIPIGPLLGGAAVFGLAVAFGAQNLIRDYFYGFVILLENQYKLNDVVKIGEISGQVENITLRMTVLRDLAGNVHFLPNGQITSVTNMTHGWSRALFSIGIAYDAQVDEVMAVIMGLCHEIRRDPVFGSMILEDATMLGVDEFAESTVTIKFYIKTRPLQQWTVKRELNRRIKNRFDELGIEIPVPQLTLWHRVEPGSKFTEPFNKPSQLLHGGHTVRQSV